MNDIDLGKLKVDRQPQATPAAGRSRFRWRAWHIALALVVLIVAWRLLFPSAVAVQTTRVVTAWPSQQNLLLDATGYVVARRKAAVASKGTGRVEWLGVSEGDQVKEGTVVARLESRDVAATYQAAVANSRVAEAGLTSSYSELSDADTNLQRQSILFRQQLTAQINMQDAMSRYDRAKAGVASAKASLAAARANEENARSAVDYTEIRAPFDGVVIARSANVGDIVTPLSSAADAKGAVVVMADMSTLEVDADVSESSLSSIRVGQPCEIVLDAFPDRRFRGEVSTVVPTVNRASATVTTKVRILDADATILPDMSARVSFLSRAVAEKDNRPLTAVSPQAVVKRGDRSVVYAVGDDGRAREIAVEPGAQLGDVRAITVAKGQKGGIKAGDVLVLSPGDKIGDGTELKLPETN